MEISQSKKCPFLEKTGEAIQGSQMREYLQTMTYDDCQEESCPYFDECWTDIVEEIFEGGN